MTPLVLLVGFLGAGKTSTLRRLLVELGQRKITSSVVLNDFLDARIDAESLAEHAGSIMPLSGSCVCCSSQLDLIAALADVPREPRRVAMVEANGATDAAALIELLSGSAALDGLTLPIQLSIVDAERWQKRGPWDALERHQVRTATHVLVTREDRVTCERMRTVLDAVERTAPQAAIVTAGRFATAVARLCTEALDRNGRQHRDPGEPASVPREVDHESTHFAASLLPITGAVDRGAFLAFLDALPPEIVRAKGVVELTEAPGAKWLFHRVDTRGEIAPFPLRNPSKGGSCLLLVGAQVPSLRIRARLGALTSAATKGTT